MPRVFTKTKNNGGKHKTYGCNKCSDPIKAGEKYYEWSFRYGGTYRQHVSHGPVRQSQLTQSKMSGVYSAIETAQDEIDSASEVEEIKSALESCADDVDSVKDEYQDSFDNIPQGLQEGGVAQEMQEKIEALESFADELRNVDLEDFDEEEPEDDEEESDEDFDTRHDKWETERDEHLETQKDEARSVLDSLSI